MHEIDRETVEKVLDAQVRPALEMHGGNLVVDEIREGNVYVRMTGACALCLSADETMVNLVEARLKEALPQIRRVILRTGVSDALLSQAMDILKKRHGQD